MAKADAKQDALRRLGGGRWETKDGRFQIEPQSGTWVVVDTAQSDELGLPLVRGPYPSLGAARDAIDLARDEGPATSPLAERLEQARRAEPPSSGASSTKPARARSRSTPEPAEPERPPDPAWLAGLQAGERRRAKELIARLTALDVPDAEAVARAEFVEGEAALARLALERRLDEVLGPDAGARRVGRTALEVIADGADDDLGVAWRLVDGKGRPIGGAVG